MKSLICILCLFLFGLTHAYSNYHGDSEDPVSTIDSLEAEQVNWHLLDPVTDQIQGVSINKVWSDIIKGKQPKKTVVVAVIDSGIDIEHEDLQGKIWINEREIPQNGIDDDKNGYIDDVYGWNFIGNNKGENIEHENLEYVRIVRKYNNKFSSVKSESEVPESEKKLYQIYLQCKKKYEEEVAKYQSEKDDIDMFQATLSASENVVKKAMDKSDYTLEDLMTLNSSDQKVLHAKNFLINLFSRGFSYEMLKEIDDYYTLRLEKHLNLEYNPRSIINDNPEDITDNRYGNNDVEGPRSDHGTFVAGIIAANRNNSIGIDGIAEHVEIMTLRVVPDGDEYDKDVALAIRYAVDNGAHIINMSFGKDFSPQKHMVDEALSYAVQKNVLIVHAAGNDAVDIDKTIHYPTARLDNNTVAGSVITVGAISKKMNYHLVGSFTNYGREEVDIFAPGVDMVSLYPGDKYNMGSGTSFSSPVVAGVAALIWSYYPDLSALELKDVLLQSATKYPKHKVFLPDETSSKKKKVKFGKLSKTGGIVNAYQALIYAEKLVEN